MALRFGAAKSLLQGATKRNGAGGGAGGSSMLLRRWKRYADRSNLAATAKMGFPLAIL